MVEAIKYETTIQDVRSTWPISPAIAGSAVATIVWSNTARNIGSMMDGKTVRNAGYFAPSETSGLLFCSGVFNNMHSP
jgi:hypothetical protein